jgi:hypothetical protein
MLNNLSFRDKVIIFVFTAILIVCAFIFAIYRPQTEEIKTLKVERNKQETAWLDKKKIIDRNPGLEKDRDALIAESKTTAALFTPLPGSSMPGNAMANSTLFIDAKMKELFDRNKIVVNNFSSSVPTPQSIPFYFNAVTTTTYPLKEDADISGDIADQLYQDTGYTRQVQNLSSPQVLTTTISISYKATRANLFALVNEIAGMGKPNVAITPDSINGTIRLTSLAIADYTFAEASEEPTEKGFSQGTLTLQIYSVDQPTFSAT